MEMEKSLNPQLWHACAGGMVQMPSLNSKVFYFPQGHAEHALANVDFGGKPNIPAFILCNVIDLKFMADLETDEVYAKIGLKPIKEGNCYDDVDEADLGGNIGSDSSEKLASFAKTLTQSDANNGGGFSVPRYCAETIFPRLDYSADPPVQTVIVKDVHGEVWKFRHIYRGTPRRHLLTTGWSTFVNQKKLVAGDSIVFMRTENGDLCVGIRRVKRGGIGGPEYLSGWSSAAGTCVSSYCGGFSAFQREDENGNKLMRSGSNVNYNVHGTRGKVRPESVLEAAYLAANGKPFDVLYYPRASTPEFCVKASSFNTAMSIKWFSGLRFKMAFETEDASRISWFMGTVSAVQVAEPYRWPQSPWRLLQVTWDEPDLLHNVKRVSPWLVELVSNIPTIHLSPCSPARKKLRIPQPPDFPLGGRLLFPSFSGNPLGPSRPLCCLSDNIPAGIQGARHARSGIPFSDLHLTNNFHMGVFPSNLQHLDSSSKMHLDSSSKITNDVYEGPPSGSSENVSCLLTIGNSSHHKLDDSEVKKKAPLFLLFGQPILTEQQLTRSCSSDAVSNVSSGKSSRVRSPHVFLYNSGSQSSELELETGHCKVFLESEDVGRTLDLSVLGSYEELYMKLSNMFGLGRFENLSRVLYKDATGAVKTSGDEPFSKFVKTAKRLTILLTSCNSDIGSKWITGSHRTEHGLDSSNQATTRPMTIFA